MSINANDDREKNSTVVINMDGEEMETRNEHEDIENTVENTVGSTVENALEGAVENTVEDTVENTVQVENTVSINANDDREMNSTVVINKDGVEIETRNVNTVLPSEMKRPMILKLFQRRAATKQSGMIVDGCGILSRKNNTVEIAEC